MNQAIYNEWKNIVYKTISEYKDNSWHIYCENHPLMNQAIYNEWKNVYKTISEYKDNSWHICCENHPLMNLANSCLSNISPSQL